MWKKAIALLVAVAIIYGGVSLYQMRHRLFRPSFDSAGGTVFIFDMLEQAGDDDIDRACAVLTKRFDAEGGAGVVVSREGKKRLSISVPNGSSHDDICDRVRRLAARRGRVEFRILANTGEDKEAMAEAEKQFRSTRDEVPVGPNDTEGGKELVVGRGLSKKRYRWFGVTEEQARQWLGHPGAVVPGGNKEVYPNVYGGMNVFVYRPAIGLPSSFVLAREPGEDERVNGEGIERARVVSGGVVTRHGAVATHSIQINFDAASADTLLMLSGRNLSPRFSRGPEVKYLAGILDGVVFTTHLLDAPVRRKTNFGVWGTTTDAEDLALLLQGGELPVKLRSPPADERTITPPGK